LGRGAGDVDETLSANGGLIGATIGLNHQFDKVVIGLEADISYASMGTDGQAFDGNIWAPGDSSVETWRTELEWLGTIRGRAGYAFDRFLVYGTAGLAIGGAVDKTRFDYDNGSGSSRSVAAQDRNTHLGWTAGVGIEAAVTEKLTAKLEYLHADLGEATYMANRGGMVLSYADMSIKTDIARIGLNYGSNSTRPARAPLQPGPAWKGPYRAGSPIFPPQRRQNERPRPRSARAPAQPRSRH
jgi:outer membrane immunogenic protein